MSDLDPGLADASIYEGVVIHRRFAPKPHALRYRMFMALLDIDRLDTVDRRLRFFSRNRFNLFAFHDRDHLPTDAPASETLRAMIERHLEQADVTLENGAIRLLTLPRICGYAFNPLSVYFCHRKDGALTAILYEVNNTFGQRHTYVIPVEPQRSKCREGRCIEQRCRKVFYVSPFLDMDMTYDFRIDPPASRIGVAVAGSQDGHRMIAASFGGGRRPLTDAAILSCLLRYPLLNLKVVAGIHWEALKLWMKGIGVRPRPSPPAHSATFVPRREV